VIPSGTNVDPLSVDFIVDARVSQTTLVDAPTRPPAVYPPLDVASASDTLTVRTLYWDEPTAISRARWRWVLDGGTPPRIELDGGFDPGRWYRVTYRAANRVVGGVALTAIRDAASAFRYRTDLPVRGRTTMAYGNSQTGRFFAAVPVRRLQRRRARPPGVRCRLVAHCRRGPRGLQPAIRDAGAWRHVPPD
jgi:hypothetical protein